jgi:hypothetical protein
MDTVVLREKDEWGRLTKESRTVTPTDYGVSAAEYALTVGSYPPPPFNNCAHLVTCLSCRSSDSWLGTKI